MLNGVSIVCPTHNEVAYSVYRINQIYRIAKKHFKTFEVVIVDDGSTDGNYQKIVAYGKNKLWLRIIRHNTNRGISQSVRDAYANARYRYVVWFSLGLEWNVVDIPKLAYSLSHADIVVGFRPHKSYHWTRNLLSNFYRKLIQTLFHIDAYDAGSIKAIKKEILDQIPIISFGVFDEAERIIRASKAGFKVTSIPISHMETQKLRQSRPSLGLSVIAFVDAIRVFIDLNSEEN